MKIIFAFVSNFLVQHHDYIPLQPYSNEELGINYQIVDEARLANAIVDLPQFSYEPESHYSSYLHALHQNQHRLHRLKDDQGIRVEYAHDYSRDNSEQNAKNQELVIPLYTNVKVKKPSEDTSSTQLRPVFNSPRQQISDQYAHMKVII